MRALCFICCAYEVYVQHKEKLAQETRIAELLARVQERSAYLLKLYDDEERYALLAFLYCFTNAFCRSFPLSVFERKKWTPCLAAT